MKARAVHAVFAAGVRSPHLIEEWEEDPESLRRYGLDPETVNSPALRKFAGLTAKVRHNGARNLLPMSFRFLAATGLELELFAAYASECSRNGQQFDTTSEERCDKLLGYLERWLDASQPDHVLLWDLIRHEYAVSSLSGRPAACSSDIPDEKRADPSCVPRICGEMILHEMQSDPRLLAAAMSQRNPRWNDIEASRHYFGYWRPSTKDAARMLELDEFSFYALHFIDGNRTAMELNELMGGCGEPGSDFLQALDQLAEAGMVRFVK
jgi:hypothetical protein